MAVEEPLLPIGFPTATVSVDGEAWVVAVAATPETRRRGLMGVTSLGDLDGMLFDPGFTTSAGFWMKDTLIPLEVAFFAEDGLLVDVLSMDPCAADPCPTYRPAGPYRWALEALPGRLGGLDAAAVLDPDGPG